MGDFSSKSRKATIFGGTGFLGRYIVQRLARQGWIVDIVTRNPNQGLFLKPLGFVGQINLVEGDFLNHKYLRGLLQGSDVIINCVGVLHESTNQKFKMLHCEIPAKLAKYASELEVREFIHISSIGANEGSESYYAKTKGFGEERIRESFPKAVILRPSIIYGAEDKFFNLFSSIANISPVIPVVGGQTLFQPVYVDDIAHAVENLLQNPSLTNKKGLVYELGGTEILSFRDLISKMLLLIKRKRMISEIPFWVADIMCPLVFLANKITLNTVPLLITRDNIKQLKKDNIVAENMPGLKELGVSPRVMDSILPSYLNRYRPKGQFADL